MPDLKQDAGDHANQFGSVTGNVTVSNIVHKLGGWGFLSIVSVALITAIVVILLASAALFGTTEDPDGASAEVGRQSLLANQQAPTVSAAAPATPTPQAAPPPQQQQVVLSAPSAPATGGCPARPNYIWLALTDTSYGFQSRGTPHAAWFNPYYVYVQNLISGQWFYHVDPAAIGQRNTWLNWPGYDPSIGFCVNTAGQVFVSF